MLGATLAHRGFWKRPEEKNSPAAFERALRAGFGIETDLRDLNGELVVSHDPPRQGALTWASFLELYQTLGIQCPPIAVNVKSDGLAERLAASLPPSCRDRFFAFDMSVPDALGYLRAGVTTFTRRSELEIAPSFYGHAQGVWMDAFFSDWIGKADIETALKDGKIVALVSSELHRRDHRDWWLKLRSWLKVMAPHDRARVWLCTDFPDQAKDFFGDN